MPAGDPGGNFANTGGYGSFNQGGGGFQPGGALNGGRGQYGLAGDRSWASGNPGAYGKPGSGGAGVPGNNFGSGAPGVVSYKPKPKTGILAQQPPVITPAGWPLYGGPLANLDDFPADYGQFDDYQGWPNYNGGIGEPDYNVNQGWNNSTQGSGPLNPGNGNGVVGGGYMGGGGGGWELGGVIQPGQVGMVGERGPELAQGLPNGGTRILPNHAIGSPPPRPQIPPMPMQRPMSMPGQAPVGIPAPGMQPNPAHAIMQALNRRSAGPGMRGPMPGQGRPSIGGPLMRMTEQRMAERAARRRMG